MLTEEDFPLLVVGKKVYGRRRMEPMLICDDEATAAQTVRVLNFTASEEIPGFDFRAPDAHH